MYTLWKFDDASQQWQNVGTFTALDTNYYLTTSPAGTNWFIVRVS